jgi:hypothetical protein
LKFIEAALVGCVVLLCGGCAKTPAPSLAGFACSDDNKTLTPEELKQKEKRIKELEQALDDTVGLEFGGRGFKFFRFGVKTCRVHNLQRKLTLEDWKLLSEIAIENYYELGITLRQRNDDVHNRHRGDAIGLLFATRGEEAIAIFEREANKKEIIKEFQKFSSDNRSSVNYRQLAREECE